MSHHPIRITLPKPHWNLHDIIKLSVTQKTDIYVTGIKKRLERLNANESVTYMLIQSRNGKYYWQVLERDAL